MEKNKTGKYLKYAFGEIILVVLGILIALQINNWNESRKERIEEVNTLSNLEIDLRSALIQLDRKMAQNRNFFLQDSILLDVIEYKKQLPKDSLEKLILGHIITPTFDPEMGTLNEIINTGKLNLIQNDSLRNHISSWNKNMDELKETNKKLIHFDINVKNPLYADKILYKNVFKSLYGGFKNMQFSRSRFNWDPEKLINTLEFENMLVNYIFFSGVQTSRHVALKRKINEMIVLISKETN